MIGVATMLLWAGLAGPGSGEIICETEPVLIRTPTRARNYVLEHVTRCYPAADPGKEQLEKLKLVCDLLITAYGEDEGRQRCQDLLAHIELEP